MTSAEPLVSVVIPAYVNDARQKALLEETLGTVEQQSYPRFEVLVVDDGSQLDFADAVSRHAKARLLRRPNGGSAQARNTGIASSSGDYFVFLDADDHLLPRALEALLQAFARHPECGFVVGGREEMTYDGGPVPWQMPQLPGGTQHYLGLLGFDWYIIPPSSAMFRRSAVERVGGFRDPWGADDLDFYLRVARGDRGVCFDEAVTRYRRYSESSSRDGERMLRSIREVYAREWPFVQGDPEARRAFQRGLQQLTRIFTDCVVENLHDRTRARQLSKALRSALVLGREQPQRLAQELLALLRHALRTKRLDRV